MQVKMKLAKLGHAQSEETKMKIGVGVRIGWEKRREKMMLQETCLYEWQNLIAEVSRRGVLGEEELQWDSYKTLDKQLEQEWIQSVEERKRMPRVKGSKRAPKSLEQRRKIAESIAAKWADPSYRQRVRAGLIKYHGITEVGERTPRTTTSSDGQTRKRSLSKRKTDLDDESAKSQNLRIKRKSKSAPYKDPLASSKLEMLKSIRAQRAAAESKKTEALVRAKLLIAEAEKAANALEVAAKQSPLARASLIETRRLIAEAVESISSIDEEEHEGSPPDGSILLTPSQPTDGSISPTSPQHFDRTDLTSAEFMVPDPSQIVARKVNGIAHTLVSSNIVDSSLLNSEDSAFHQEATDDDASGDNDNDFVLAGDCESDAVLGFDLVRPSDSDVTVNGKKNSIPQMSAIGFNLGSRLSPGDGDKGHISMEQAELKGTKLKEQSEDEETPQKLANVVTKKKKKWVRGRLVEVDDEED
ncbi:OLC1v1015261C2 [Oldenlandia corymbosa var. corymbosa]|uniref:OLC1v1015261C2 n=1 Tax=Oldenlandia corymbosa var. corymbosa TaxID=529605 RepID=A0AAV1E686_OLDCO|nr:OLC1v1015261C2 [Oldenlandia corymbosa var. corymbosa]